MVLNVIIILLFCIFSIIGFVLMFRNNYARISNPIDRSSSITITGPQQFLFYTIATGMIMFNYEGFSINLSAIRLLSWIVLLIAGILFTTKSRINWSPVLFLYMLYLVWLLIMTTLSPVKEFAIRNFLKYLFPFLIFIFAMKCNVGELLFIKYLKGLVNVSLILLAITYIPPVNNFLSPLFWGLAAFADYFTVIALVCIGLFRLTKDKKYLFFCILFLSYSLFHVIRTGIIGFTAGLSIFYLIIYRIKSIPVITIVIVLFLAAIFLIPGIRNKMFKDNNKKNEITAEQLFDNENALSIDDINTNARQAMWEWSLAKFYENKKLTGSGLGVLQATFYSKKHPFGALLMVHNDYVQIMCDTGLIGLILFLSIFLAMLWHCILIYKNKKSNNILKLAALLSGSTLTAVMVCSITDNAVNYSLATYCYPFIFYGITLFLLQKRKEYDKHRNPIIQQRKIS